MVKTNYIYINFLFALLFQLNLRIESFEIGILAYIKKKTDIQYINIHFLYKYILSIVQSAPSSEPCEWLPRPKYSKQIATAKYKNNVIDELF